MTELGAELGRRVERGWAAASHDHDAFSDIAASELALLDAPADLDVAELLADVIAAPSLPEQQDPMSRFGQPPITIWAGRRIVVTILVCFDGTTAIHDHAFSGAFRVLSGSSAHCRYRFEPTKSLDRHVHVGELACTHVEALRVGDTRAIVGGPSGAHSLFHLDHPSVTLLVRTIAEPWHEPQLVYQRSGLASASKPSTADSTRRLEVIAAGARLAPEVGAALAVELIDSESPLTSVQAHEVCRRNDVEGVDLEPVTAAIAARWPELVDPLTRLADGERREVRLRRKRRSIRDPLARAALAVVLSVDPAQDPTAAARTDLFRMLAADSSDDHDHPGPMLADVIHILTGPELAALSGLELTAVEVDELVTAAIEGTPGAQERVWAVLDRMGEPSAAERLVETLGKP